MEPLTIQGTDSIPTVNFNAEAGKLEIKGICIPENSQGFFKPLIDWVRSYANHAPPQTEVSLFMEYFNTSSSKYIFTMLEKLADMHNDKKSDVKVNWHYDEGDEDMLEVGEDYNTILDVPFQMIEVAD